MPSLPQPRTVAGAGFPYVLHFSADGALPSDVQVLARVVHGVPAAGDIHVPLAVLDGPALVETWTSVVPVRRFREAGVDGAENGEVLIGALALDETELERLGVAAATQQAYRHIEQLLHARGYPHCLRVWNFLSRINEGEGDAERYRQFVLGRHQALSPTPGFETSLPAATAIGSTGGGLRVHFVAARTAGVQVENPRQVSAFHYPRDYGPRSPSFSRAVLKSWAGGAHLYVSGTASVVGHESRHAGDVAGQLREVLRNVEALQRRAAPSRAPADWRTESVKVYLRDARDLAAVTTLLRTQLPATAPWLVLQGDICRRELLVEIEGIYALDDVTR